jgi:hypothetical protein
MSLTFFELHGDISQKTILFKAIAVRSSNPKIIHLFAEKKKVKEYGQQC